MQPLWDVVVVGAGSAGCALAARLVDAGRTVLLATQRLSTLALADRVVVLQDGAVVEEGTLTELLARDGTFAALFGEDAVAA